MSEKTFWNKVKKIDKEYKKIYANEIKALIKASNNYNSFDDISYDAMENAMPGKNLYTDDVLGYYANGLEGIITG
jgi:hypothetical protein